MKIRVSSDAIRVRLSSKDVTYLESNDELELTFPTGLATQLTFSLRLNEESETEFTEDEGELTTEESENEADDGLNHCEIRQIDSSVLMNVPRESFLKWLSGNEIEFATRIEIPKFKLVIEKDILQ